MNPKKIENNLKQLCFKTLKTEVLSIDKLPNSGSNRKYYRLNLLNSSIIGVYNDYPLKENEAFINFTNHFNKHKIKVPKIIAYNPEECIYIINDLGNITLLDWLNKNRDGKEFPKKAIDIYKKVLSELVQMQIIAGKDFNYDFCFQNKEFNKESILLDLNYFKDKFLTTQNINFDDNKLVVEFNRFANHLLEEDNNFFMFRDFQARNIMLVDNEPYFIDYQGGRKGALQYDLASLLFQAKAQIPTKIKLLLIDFYIEQVRLLIPISSEKFIKYFYSFSLVRVLQTLGAYGLRGIIEQKAHFLESIPFAINNLKELFPKVEILEELSELKSIISEIINTKTHI
jgi:aminoglycoside/choline kinase family phosphotransferase